VHGSFRKFPIGIGGGMPEGMGGSFIGAGIP
jgi:hypothetical protein